MTPDQHEAFERDGYLVVRGALAADEIRRFRLTASDTYRREREEGHLGPDRGLHLRDVVTRVPDFSELVTHPATAGLVRAALGQDAALDHAHLEVYPQALHAGTTRWHRHVDDAPPATATDRRAAVTVVYWLSDASETGRGNLLVAPGSHRTGAAGAGFHRDPDPPAPSGTVDLAVAAGDAVLLDRRIWHARSTNYSPFVSTCLHVGYGCRPDAGYRPGDVGRDVVPELALAT